MRSISTRKVKGSKLEIQPGSVLGSVSSMRYLKRKHTTNAFQHNKKQHFQPSSNAASEIKPTFCETFFWMTT